MLETKLNNVRVSNESKLITKAKATAKDILNLAIFLGHAIAGYALHDNTNGVLATTGVFLLILAITQLLSISFRETESLNK